MSWLALSRALQGTGAGGIVNSVWTIAPEIVPPKDRSKWSQALSLTWSSSAVAGPLLGGLFSGAGPYISFMPCDQSIEARAYRSGVQHCQLAMGVYARLL